MSRNEAHDSFVERLDRHRGIVYKISAAYGRERANREDLQQEIVMQLWRSYPRFDERAKFSTWMYRIALNVAISFARRHSRTEARVDLVEPAIIEALPAANSEPSDERIERVVAFIGGLDELNRADAALPGRLSPRRDRDDPGRASPRNDTVRVWGDRA
ncbi:MAG TPA: sigma-70 family RNA polymerase sigma factor [Candidatus Cybelea sp.]|jgi:RNA polymerase sigma-70 factor (ECF subfamily)